MMFLWCSMKQKNCLRFQFFSSSSVKWLFRRNTKKKQNQTTSSKRETEKLFIMDLRLNYRFFSMTQNGWHLRFWVYKEKRKRRQLKSHHKNHHNEEITSWKMNMKKKTKKVYSYLEGERTNSWPTNSVAGCTKDAINQTRVGVAVSSFNQIAGWLCMREIYCDVKNEKQKKEENGRQALTHFIEIEWKFSWNGTVETRLQESRPPVTEAMRTTFVPFADSRNSTVDGLEVN